MNSSENIRNALQVLYKTYENVKKLMDYTKIVAQEKTDYILSTPKFLRYKSDSETQGWLMNDFILAFQNSTDPDCESGNGWKNAPIYAVEIYLGDEDYEEDDYPSIYLSKFEYNEMNSWSEGCSPTNHWVFYWPLRDENDFNFTQKGDYWIATPKNEKISNTYWTLKNVITYKIDLIAVSSDNLKQMIFDNFDLLKKFED